MTMATFVLTFFFAAAALALLAMAWIARTAAAPTRAWVIAAAVCLALAVWGVADMVRAQSGAHGQGHAEGHDWYQHLKQPGTGFSCCNGDTVDSLGNRREGDCRPTRAFLGEDGRWRALVDGHWREVPSRVVLEGRFNRDPLRAHVCASKTGMIYCFLGAGDGS